MAKGYLDRRAKTKIQCPNCKQKEMARIARRGFLRLRIFPMLGLYPWQCAICGKEELHRRRGAVMRKSQRNPEEPGAEGKSPLRTESRV
jgi:predicted RNA-binding Zn-ribbon protein involved in translation (DUF1610 family)